MPVSRSWRGVEAAIGGIVELRVVGMWILGVLVEVWFLVFARK